MHHRWSQVAGLPLHMDFGVSWGQSLPWSERASRKTDELPFTHSASHLPFLRVIDAGLRSYETRCGGPDLGHFHLLASTCVSLTVDAYNHPASALVQIEIIDPPEVVFSADIDSSTTSALPFNFERQRNLPASLSWSCSRLTHMHVPSSRTDMLRSSIRECCADLAGLPTVT